MAHTQVDNWHVGRSFAGHRLEDDCPCPKEACGLVNMQTVDNACPQHGFQASKTIRQGHRPEDCAGAEAY
jgi:hypothetical protein